VRVIPLMVTAELKLLVKVTVCAAGVAPTGQMEKFSADGEAISSEPTITFCALDAVEPGLVTVMDAVAADAINEDAMVARKDVHVPPGCMVAPVAEPFHRICAAEEKPLPVAVNVKFPDPAAMEFGWTAERDGVVPDGAATVHQLVMKTLASTLPSPVT